MSVKNERINSNVQRELSYILANEVKNPNIKFITITAVDVTSDLSYAKVYFTCFDEDRKVVLKELKESAGFIRGEVSKRVEIRHTPELTFEYDESLEYAKRIEEKLKEIKE